MTGGCRGRDIQRAHQSRKHRACTPRVVFGRDGSPAVGAQRVTLDRQHVERDGDLTIKLRRKFIGALPECPLQLRTLRLADLSKPAVLERAQQHHEQDQCRRQQQPKGEPSGPHARQFTTQVWLECLRKLLKKQLFTSLTISLRPLNQNQRTTTEDGVVLVPGGCDA